MASLLNTNIGPERVQVFPVPLGTTQVPGAGISTASFLISTTFVDAPINIATPVTDMDMFETAFGDMTEIANEAFYAVKGFFDNAGTGNTAYIVNVGTSPTPASYIGNSALGTGLRALDAIDDIGQVMAPGLPLSQAYLVQSAVVDYTEIVRAEFGATLSTSFSLLAMPQEITKANLDTTLVTAQLLSVTGTGPWTLHVQVASTAVAATGTVTVVNFALAAGDVVTVAGHTLTEGVEWNAGASNTAAATSLAAAISALTEVNATALAAVITVTAATPGVAGNSITLVTSDVTSVTVSAPTLTGGSNGNANLSSVTAGMVIKNTGNTYTGVISALNDSTDTLVVTPNPSTFFTAGDDVIVKVPSAVTYKNLVVANSSSKTAAWYYNSLVVVDLDPLAASGDLVITDPVGHVAGIIARMDANIQIGGPSHAPAGQQYAGIVGINGLALSVSERLDAEPLRKNFINRITSFAGVGPVIFGGYTADNGISPSFTADEQKIQVIRSIQFVKKSLEPGLRVFLWENFDPTQQGKIQAAIESFLRNNSYLFPAGLPESQQFKVISVVPTQDELNQGLLKVRVQCRFNTAILFIEVDLEFPLPSAG